MNERIEDFLAQKKVAVVGASRDPGKMGHAMVKELAFKGYEVYPVNPAGGEIAGRKCTPRVGDLPKDVTAAILMVKAEAAPGLVAECAAAGIRKIWLHQGAGGMGSSTPEALAACGRAGIEPVHGLCPLMFYPPAGIHRVHYFFRKLSGGVPKELL
ncbi:MAG: CoA-binding protein [Spirochaetaceae bacterium]|nr:CoA-binding protein [Spirochaetaceae bacterium]